MGQEEALFESRESLPFESGSPSSVMLESELPSCGPDLQAILSFPQLVTLEEMGQQERRTLGDPQPYLRLVDELSLQGIYPSELISPYRD